MKDYNDRIPDFMAVFMLFLYRMDIGDGGGGSGGSQTVV